MFFKTQIKNIIQNKDFYAKIAIFYKSTLNKYKILYIVYNTENLPPKGKETIRLIYL